MGKKAAKSTRKFAQSGQLKKAIQARRKHQEIKRKAERRKGKPGSDKAKRPVGEGDKDDGEDVESVVEEKKAKKSKGMSVDDFLGSFAGPEDDIEESLGSEDENADEDEDDEDTSDDGSFASVDALEDDEGAEHMHELSKLAEKDPEFYKYLQENDKELLDFDPHAAENEVDEDDDDLDPESEDMAPVLTLPILKKWSKALLEQRSLRALRKLLTAFRAAVHMNEEDQVLAWTIDSSAIYDKLVTTALRYTPIILQHHCQYKSLPNGKFKPPTQTQKWKTLQKLILSYFHNVIHLLTQLTNSTMVELAISESAKLIPYVIGSRKAVKAYLKTCLNLWSSGEDSVRIAAFLAIRRLASATDESILNMVLKNTYLTLIRSCKSTSAHTLPSINLMKNSASEIYTMDHSAAYQHAFGYIRQLAIHLRNSMRMKSKEAYKQVYNWQYVHCVDFWSIVLARACDHQTLVERGDDSELKALIYPLVQVTLGAVKLIPNARSYPLHLHLTRSLLHLTRHTLAYVPLAPYLLPILAATLSTLKPKASTLRPLDFETNIRAPQQYLKTRVYNEGLAEETTYLLAEYLSSPAVHGSIAFPEVVVPISTTLRKAVKAAKGSSWKAKETGLIKSLVERVEESAKWVEQQRKGVTFAPSRLDDVGRWERDLKLEDSPLFKYVKVQKKVREKRRKLVEKAREGEDEILED